jgi:hypothetical protein
MNMSKELKKNWLPKQQARYARRSREGKSRMLDELCEDYKYERKYAIKLLRGGLPTPTGRVHPGPERKYQVVEPVVRQIWLTAEQPCGKRLAPVLRQWLPYYEKRYGQLSARQRNLIRSAAGPSPGSTFKLGSVRYQTGKFVALGDSDSHRHLGPEPARVFGG